MFFSTASARKITDGAEQILCVIWKNAKLLSGETISGLTVNWRNAIVSLDPTASTPGSWTTLSQIAHDDGKDTLPANSTLCDAVITTSWHGQIVRSFTLKNVTQSGLAAAIAAASDDYFGVQMPHTNVYISNITINVKEGANNEL